MDWPAQRPVYFFDEWTRTRILQFKGVFYFELLPELKAQAEDDLPHQPRRRIYPLADRADRD